MRNFRKAKMFTLQLFALNRFCTRWRKFTLNKNCIVCIMPSQVYKMQTMFNDPKPPSKKKLYISASTCNRNKVPDLVILGEERKIWHRNTQKLLYSRFHCFPTTCTQSENETYFVFWVRNIGKITRLNTWIRANRVWLAQNGTITNSHYEHFDEWF